jgi:Carbohydrate esterase, sialic acid-specific acetylesterase
VAGSSGAAAIAGAGGAAAGGAAAGNAATGGAATGGAAGAGSGGVNSAGSAGSAAGGAGGMGGGGAGSGGEPVFHIFMLMGQSNMAGVAKSEASDKNTDERLKVWGGCNQKAGQWNLANPPLSDCPGGSGINLSTSVDPGIWFAKTLLKKLPAGHTIGLIGTAESGEKIETFITGGKHHDAIMKKIAAVKTAPNARFAGVIFHQGESNTGQATWPGLVKQLYNEVKQAFGVSYDVPFILGELPAGGCCSSHNTRVHEAAMQLPMGSYVSQQDTKVMDQYHFDHASVVLMGTRYGDKMLEALKW